MCEKTHVSGGKMDIQRYNRQEKLKYLQGSGQKKLFAASILLVGAGGLGCSVLQGLAGAGIGRIGIMDHDRITLNNLNRQFLYTPADIGRWKTEVAAAWLARFSPGIQSEVYTYRLTRANADLAEEFDLVIAAVDNLETRLLLNEACVRRNIPLIDGGINGWGGCLFYVKQAGGPCLACLYPQAMENDREPAAFGTMAGMIGMAQAQMAVLALTGHTEGFEGKYIWFDGVNMEFHHTIIQPQSGCVVCGGHAQKQAGNESN